VKTNRIPELDEYRGFAVLYIVAIIHPIFWFLVTPAWISWILVEMPFVFGLAGYVFGLSRSRRRESWWRYFAKRTERLILPCAIYLLAGVAFTVLDNWRTVDRLYTLEHAWIWWLPTRFHDRISRPHFLTSHLWFVPVMLGVSAAMPLFHWFENRQRGLMTVWAFALVVLGCSPILEFPDAIRDVFLYAAWAYTGFAMSKGFRPSAAALAATSVSAVVVLLAGHALDLWSLHMQSNKFPASLPFALFTLSVVPTLYAVIRATRAPGPFMRNAVTAPFAKFSYTSYLWHPVAFLFIERLGVTALPRSHRALVAVPVVIVWTTLIARAAGRGENVTVLRKFLRQA
jgi:peptidoglycan/LPS O-acetylase OafA/YrhL